MTWPSVQLLQQSDRGSWPVHTPITGISRYRDTHILSLVPPAALVQTQMQSINRHEKTILCQNQSRALRCLFIFQQTRHVSTTTKKETALPLSILKTINLTNYDQMKSCTNDHLINHNESYITLPEISLNRVIFLVIVQWLISEWNCQPWPSRSQNWMFVYFIIILSCSQQFPTSSSQNQVELGEWATGHFMHWLLCIPHGLHYTFRR